MAKMRNSSAPRRRPADRGRASRRIYETVDAKRSVLAHMDLAKRSSKATLTRLINQGRRSAGIPMATDGGKLKNSVLAMADTMGVTDEEYQRLLAMDEDTLARLYEDNRLTFEVYFNYEGISDSGGFHQVGEQKQADLDFFFSQYERYAASGL